VEHREQPRDFARSRRKLSSAGVVVLNFWGRVALGREKRNREGHPKGELLLDTVGAVWKRLEQLESRRQMVDRLGVRRELHRALSGTLRILDGLPGVATVALMVG
jgi:hypothetical protein